MGSFSGNEWRLMTMLWLTAIYFFVEIVVGYITNSMALVADSFHMLSDVAALVVAFVSVRMSPKKWSKNTFGWARAEVLGALINAVFLVALCFSITVEACKRFIEIEPIYEPKLLVVVGALGLVVNLIGLLLFHKQGGGAHGHGHSHGHVSVNRSNGLVIDTNDTDESLALPTVAHPIAIATPSLKNRRSHDAAQLNMKEVFLHILSDALGSCIVVVSALVVWLTEWKYKYYIDPSLSILLVVLIVHSVWPLLRESALILLQTVPTHIQVDSIRERLMEKVDGVLGVHEFHVWQLAGDRIIASAHIKCRNLSEYMKIAEQVKEFFHHEGIHSTTIQPEFVDLRGILGPSPAVSDERMNPCALDCPITDTPCVRSTCCGSSKQSLNPNEGQADV